MRRAMLLLMALILVSGGPVLADVTIDGRPQEEDPEGFGGVSFDPIRAGRLEVTPVMAMSYANNGLVYRAGVTVAYSLTRMNQLGGSFVMGNRVWDRANPREVVDIPQVDARQGYFSVDEGFGSSLTGFYRLNIPIEVEKHTYPYLEVFGGRDFGWGDVSEVGGALGLRKFVSRKTAVTSQYAFSTLFADGDHVTRHVVSAGVSMFFR
jgi:hypothetical protein